MMGVGQKHWFFEFVVKDWMTAPDVSLLKDSTRGIWFDALCCMFLNDRCGQLDGSLADLAVLCRTTPNNMRAAIADLKQRNAADVTERDGNVTLVNRRMRRAFVDRKSASDRKKRQRDREGGNGVTPDVTDESPPNTHTHTHTPQPPEGVPGFDRFWSAYPSGYRKAQEDKCRGSWIKLKCEPLAQEILLALEAWIRSATWTKQDGEFICAPLVWLNQKRWTLPAPPAAKTGAANVPSAQARVASDVAEKQRIARSCEVTAYLSSLEPVDQDLLMSEYRRSINAHPDAVITQGNSKFRDWVYERMKREVVKGAA